MTLLDDRGLEAVEQWMREVVAGGVAGAMALEHLASGGKRLRARLALAAAEALGKSRQESAAWAAACELLHNATLVHDDLQDGDEQRRGRPTVWVRHGVAQAINVGDLLFMAPFLALRRLACGAERQWWLAEELARCTSEVVRGQAAELLLPQASSWDAYEAAVTGKTSALFVLPVWGAAVLAGRTRAEAESLSRGFQPLGLLFQMQDDVLDLYGDKGRGAPASDLYEGKVSCLVVEHLRLHPGERERVLALLAAPRAETPADEVAALVQRFDDGGALDAVVARLLRLVEAIDGDGELTEVPELHRLARDLADAALLPIKHVLHRGR